MAKQKISTNRSRDLGKGIVWRENRKLYRARVTSSWEYDAKGRPKVYEHWSKSLDDCRKWQAEMKVSDDHRVKKPRDMTVQELWDEWHEYRSDKVAAGRHARNTLRNNEERWEQNIRPVLGKKKKNSSRCFLPTVLLNISFSS